MTYQTAAFVSSLLLLSTASEAATPTLAEAIRAVRNYCPALREPITRVSCQGMGEEEPTEAVCSYRVGGKKPRKDKTYFAIDAHGWHLIDEPTYCPGMKQGH
jgi:hypothetical protein